MYTASSLNQFENNKALLLWHDGISEKIFTYSDIYRAAKYLSTCLQSLVVDQTSYICLIMDHSKILLPAIIRYFV